MENEKKKTGMECGADNDICNKGAEYGGFGNGQNFRAGFSEMPPFNNGQSHGGQPYGQLHNGQPGVFGGQFAGDGQNANGNKVFLKGKVDSKLNYSHELYGEGFYEFFMLVPRLSQQFDRLPVTVSERLINEIDLSLGAPISLNGQFRSYNKLDGERSKLMLTVFARDFILSSEDANPNIAELSGYICKPPVYRTTPFNREICDLLLAVNRAYNKSDYIPCIAWGRNARFVKTIAVGQRLFVSGRIQSREYNKKIGDDAVETRTAYELSVNKIIME